MRRFLVVALASAAGCASPSETLEPVTMPDDLAAWSPDEIPAATAAPRDDARAAIASIPAGDASAARRWDAAGADDDEVRVVAARDRSPLAEEWLVGGNAQPEWTLARRWARSRAYVLAPGQVEVEQWYRLTTPRNSGPFHFWQTEIGLGFEGGWQLDLYENYRRNPDEEALKHDGAEAEVRYALADWGRIPANPTLYGSYAFNHRHSDVWEAKVLFTDEYCPGWHWAANVGYEQETSGVRTSEISATLGVSYTVIDRVFSVGAEADWRRFRPEGGDPENVLMAGPSLQWRPTENSHVNIAPLWGLTYSDRRDPRFELWVVLGYDFGPPDNGHRSAPVSARR